jgi:hypothetical protein
MLLMKEVPGRMVMGIRELALSKEELETIACDLRYYFGLPQAHGVHHMFNT